MDLELDPDQQLIPQWPKVRHRWVQSHSKSGPYIVVKKGTTQIWIWRIWNWIWIQSWPTSDWQWDIDGTWAGATLDIKWSSKIYIPNIDLDLELTPQNWPHFEYSYGDKTLDGSSYKTV